ncbi:MAG: excinuclease ABC subunit C [Candidatus Harrisonbacteria bacterium CG10_big_fil_rev_8_21_14_0_10_49_15]|uniref:Excinuclease ABC subunit C n=1 Tax=Candidatus Harrisonbacteria bacterium CG10_big_fil_rev_8_21_14_0_10_49_15 TaxID=1974587 RepID=A0A2H0ULR5_9BACT|nr:MAG: excinuclease ABC subunit C [Candidatus Harrisonbacteria bacterium CG10_big_fil_rev_8_21_14_0_10_49_15]
MQRSYYVYILASKRNGTLYIGVTNDLEKRVYQHQQHLIPGFTQKYNATLLVYYEETGSVEAAIRREKQLKKWNRAWKIRKIEEQNPEWRDLSKGWRLDPTIKPEDDRKV